MLVSNKFKINTLVGWLIALGILWLKEIFIECGVG
jgi:hypothetical protein